MRIAPGNSNMSVCSRTAPVCRLIVTLAVPLWQKSSFLTGSNLVKIIEQSSITILLGLGEFFAILLGGIDLSVSSKMCIRDRFYMSESSISKYVMDVTGLTFSDLVNEMRIVKMMDLSLIHI